MKQDEKNPSTLRNLLPLFSNPDLKQRIPVFSREIFLLKTTAVGCRYVPGIAERLRRLETGQKLRLVREHENAYDKRAILILDGDRKLGYISRQENGILSRLMDAGKYLYATADDCVTDPEDPDFQDAALTISIFMRD